jgi:hypothetical protein
LGVQVCSIIIIAVIQPPT